MDYKYKVFTKETNKIKGEHKIATVSDINLEIDSTLGELIDLFLGIHDIYPEYIFLLGNLFPYYYLENNNFKHNITHFLNLLVAISKVYIVFGKNDYLLEDNKAIQEDYLEEFYSNQGITVLNNKVENIDNFSFIGYNRSISLYNTTSTAALKQNIIELIKSIKDTINNNNFKIFLTNTHKDLLKLDLDFFKTLDLIISGQLPKSEKGTKQNFIKKEATNEEHNLLKNNGLTIIGNGGINALNDNSSDIGEIDMIKILSKKR